MIRYFALFFIALFFSSAPAYAGPVKVVATFSILADITKQVGGEWADVKTLIGADEDAHGYNATPATSKILARADLVIENGLNFEGWLTRLVSASGFKGVVVTASKGVSPRTLAKDGTETPDPHAWQDVSNVRQYVRNIEAALSKALPEKSAYFRARATAYDLELEKLDTWVKSEIGQIPPDRRKIITGHDAFGYFGRAYGVELLSPQGIDTEVEPTAAQVAALVDQMKKENIGAVFFENMASPKLISRLAKDAGAKVGKPVYSDALSQSDGPAPTYSAMVRYNVKQFKEAMSLKNTEPRR